MPRPRELRWPFQELDGALRALGYRTREQKIEALGIPGKHPDRTWWRWRRLGVPDRSADAVAIHLGLHPALVWTGWYAMDVHAGVRTRPYRWGMPMHEPGRQAAHVLLDASSVWVGVDDGTEVADRALRRLNEVGAVTARYDDDTDEVDVNVSDLVSGAIVTIHWLVHQLAAERGTDPHEVSADVRAFLDAA